MRSKRKAQSLDQFEFILINQSNQITMQTFKILNLLLLLTFGSMSTRTDGETLRCWRMTDPVGLRWACTLTNLVRSAGN
jgi:hypothetical protein